MQTVRKNYESSAGTTTSTITIASLAESDVTSYVCTGLFQSSTLSVVATAMTLGEISLCFECT